MTLGRLVISTLTTLFHVDPFYTYGAANVSFSKVRVMTHFIVDPFQALAGTLTALSPFIKTELGLLCYAVSFGFLNISVPFIRTSAALLLGQQSFALAYGWILAVNGVALFIGPAFAGNYTYTPFSLIGLY